MQRYIVLILTENGKFEPILKRVRAGAMPIIEGRGFQTRPYPAFAGLEVRI